jgi:dolichyl-phosphate beta-glucosyltransferase
MKSISFIIPVYNEEERIGKTFKALRELQLPFGLKLQEVIFVNDGSSDNTKFQISNFKFQMQNRMKITLLSYRQNQGKGYAIRRGMLASSADYTLFFDADMSTPLSELKKFMPYMKRNTDVIVGTRKNGKSTVIKHQPLYRELLGKGFTKVTQVLLGVPVTDFTCGFKAFSREAKQVIFPQTRINGWGYDAELLFLAFKENVSVAEKAVLWSNDERTKVNLFKAVPQTLLELMTIHRYHTFPAVTTAFLTLPQRLNPKWATIK